MIEFIEHNIDFSPVGRSLHRIPDFLTFSFDVVIIVTPLSALLLTKNGITLCIGLKIVPPMIGSFTKLNRIMPTSLIEELIIRIMYIVLVFSNITPPIIGATNKETA